MATPQRYELGSAQRIFLHDQLQYPDNSWTSIRRTIRLAGHLTDTRVRSLLTLVGERYEAVRGRMVREDSGGFRQQVIGTEEFLERSVVLWPAAVGAGVHDLMAQPLDVFRESSRWVVARGGTATVIHLLAHHAFFDGEALNLLCDGVRRLAAEPEGRTGQGQEVQPRDVHAWEQRPAATRNTQWWTDFHSRPQAALWPRPAPAPQGLLPENICDFDTGSAMHGLLHAAARRTATSPPSLINSLICSYAGAALGRPEVTLKTICANRTLPALRKCVTSLAAPVWITRQTAGSDAAPWHQGFHADLLRAYRRGLYDWEQLRTTANFRTPFRSEQTVSTNVTIRRAGSGVPPPAAPREFHLTDPLTVPFSLSHDFAVFAVLVEENVNFSVRVARRCMTESDSLKLAGGLYDYMMKELDDMQVG